MYTSKFMQKTARLFYNRKVFGVMAVGSKEVTSIRLRLSVPPDKLELYRSLLPPQLSMPAVPRIYFYVSEFNGVFPVHIEGGYREAAVCLRAGCKIDSKTDPAQGGWYPVEMPVSAKSALNSGLMMGYPKYMADISPVAKDGSYDSSVKVEGREFFRMKYDRADVKVEAMEEDEMTVPFYLVADGRVNIMQNEVVEQKSLDSLTGTIGVGIDSNAKWMGLLNGPQIKGPGVLKLIAGRFNLTRRSR